MKKVTVLLTTLLLALSCLSFTKLASASTIISAYITAGGYHRPHYYPYWRRHSHHYPYWRRHHRHPRYY